MPRFAGMALAVASLARVAWSDGAWNLATGPTAGATFALLAIFHAGAVSQARVARRAAGDAAVGLPVRSAGVLRRMLVFL